MTEVLAANRIPLEDYADVVGAGEIEELRALAKPLRGRSIEMINSTAVGGGVAEILNRLVPLAEELDLAIRWDVMKGAEDFFDVTKSFHNALHGEPYQAKPEDFEVFLSYNEQNRATLPLDAEFMVIHDPQPAALIDGRPSGSNHWVWRCHIDLSHPNRAVWDFLERFVSRYHGTMFLLLNSLASFPSRNISFIRPLTRSQKRIVHLSWNLSNRFSAAIRLIPSVQS